MQIKQTTTKQTLYAKLPAEIETFRDYSWRREAERRVENVIEAERFIADVGFANSLTDSRTPGASLYVAVCGRRDCRQPRNVQKDPEMSAAWNLKDEILRRGNLYYGRLRGARTFFIRRSLIPHFNAIYGIEKSAEAHTLSSEAQAILRVLRSEWEMATKDLRLEAGITQRARFTSAMEELQRTMKVIPLEAVYQPRFTYIWTLTEARFATELKTKIRRDAALTEIARTFLENAGITLCGELARVSGLSRPDAGRGNQALVKQNLAYRSARGVYRWHKLKHEE